MTFRTRSVNLSCMDRNLRWAPHISPAHPLIRIRGSGRVLVQPLAHESGADDVALPLLHLASLGAAAGAPAASGPAARSRSGRGRRPGRPKRHAEPDRRAEVDDLLRTRSRGSGAACRRRATPCPRSGRARRASCRSRARSSVSMIWRVTRSRLSIVSRSLLSERGLVRDLEQVAHDLAVLAVEAAHGEAHLRDALEHLLDLLRAAPARAGGSAPTRACRCRRWSGTRSGSRSRRRRRSRASWSSSSSAAFGRAPRPPRAGSPDASACSRRWSSSLIISDSALVRRPRAGRAGARRRASSWLTRWRSTRNWRSSGVSSAMRSSSAVEDSQRRRCRTAATTLGARPAAARRGRGA